MSPTYLRIGDRRLEELAPHRSSLRPPIYRTASTLSERACMPGNACSYSRPMRRQTHAFRQLGFRACELTHEVAHGRELAASRRNRRVRTRAAPLDRSHRKHGRYNHSEDPPYAPEALDFLAHECPSDQVREEARVFLLSLRLLCRHLRVPEPRCKQGRTRGCR